MYKRIMITIAFPAAVAIAASILLTASGQPAGVQGPPTTAPSQFDEAGVRAAVTNRIQGSLHLDAHLSAKSFSDDAIWINAFGRRVVGRAAIEKFFVQLYASPGYAQR